MKTMVVTDEQVCENREDLAEKYFDGITGEYAKSNMGIITLLSDLQHEITALRPDIAEHYRQILNDIKLILIKDNKE
jgi:hypothetical protein